MASAILTVAAPDREEDPHWTGKYFLQHVLAREHATAPPLTGMAIIIAPVLVVQSARTVPNLSPKSSCTTVTTPGALG